MPRRINKPAVAIMTLCVMAMTIFAGVLLVRAIPSKDPGPLVRRAEEAIAKGEYRLAVTLYQQAYSRSQDPKHIVLAADAARDMGESGAALSLWQRAILKDPNCLEARQHSLAFWLELLEMNDWRVSADAATQIASDADVLLERQKDDFTGLFARGVANIGRRVEKPEKEAKGLEDLQKALELKPTDLRVLAVLRDYWVSKSQPEKAEKIGKDLIQRLPEDPTGYLVLGQFYLMQKKPDEAMERLKKAVSLGKNMSEAAVALSQAYMLKRDYPAAEQLLAATQQANPDSFDACVQRVQLLMMAERPAEALTLAQEWLKRPAILQGYKASRNRMQRLQMQVQAASACLALTAAKDPANPEAEMLKKAEAFVKEIEKDAGQGSAHTDLLWGRIHRLRGNIVDATKSLEKADKAFNGQYPDVRLRLAELYLLQKEPGLAQKMLASVIQLAPDYGRAYYMAAMVAAQLGDLPEALNKVEAGLRIEPNDRDMRQLKATLLQASGQKAQSVDVETKLGEPTSVSERLQRAYQKLADKKPQEAEALYRDILTADPANTTALRTLLALLLQDNREPEARKVYDAARKAAPDNGEIRQMELAFAGEMTPEQREQKILEVIRAEKDEYARNTQLYAYYISRQKLDEAQKVADELEKARPEEDRVVAMQFATALMKQDWTRAQKYVDLAARKDLDGAEGGFYKARLSTARGDMLKAVDDLNLALGKYPSFSDGWILLADVFLKLNRLEDARKAIDKSLELNPTKGEGYKGLAQIAAAMGNQAAYEQNLAKAVQYLRDDPWVAEQVTNLTEQKDPKKAIDGRQKYLETHPDDLSNMTRLALLLEKQQQYKQASDLIERAQKLQPKDLSLAWLAATYWQRRSDSAKAEKTLLDLAQVVDPERKSAASTLLAQLYVVQRLPEKAEQAYSVAAKQAPERPTAFTNLAAFYRDAGRIEDAIKAYRQALGTAKKERSEESAIRQQMVETLLQSRKLDEAATEVNAYHQAFPDDPVYQLLQGTLLMLQGRTEEAVNTLTTYLQREPNSGPGRYHRGLMYLGTNRLPQAIDDLTLAKQLSPTGFNFEHRTALAQAYEANGQIERAISELNEILGTNPQATKVAILLAAMYQRANRTSDLEILIRKYMDLAPQDWTWAQMLGDFGKMTGNYAMAVEGYATAAKVSQFRVEAVDNLLQTQIAAKRYDQAIDFVEKTMPEPSRVRVAKARLAQALFLQGKKEKARPLFTQAIAEAAKDYVSSVLVARVATETLGADQVIELLKQRMAAEPDSLVIQYMLVAMLGEQKQWEAADQVSNQLLAAAKSNDEKAMVLRQRGSLFYQEGKHEAASKAYEELLKVAPDDGEAINNVAYILAEDVKRPQEALRYAKRAVELQPRNPNVMDTLGWVYCLAGDQDNAIGTLVSGLQIAPDNVALRYHVAVAYQKQGKLDQAKRELQHAQQVIDKSPQDPMADMFQDKVKKALSGLSGAAGK